MKIKEVKSSAEMIGVVIPSEKYGNVKIVEFKEEKNWGRDVIVYLDKFHSDNALGRFHLPVPWLEGGALRVERTTDPVTEFEE